MRIEQHPILDFKRGNKIHFTFDGKEVFGYEGETISAALHASDIVKLSESFRTHRPRGLFCAIGHCSSCLMTVDGIPNVRICVTNVKDGMIVESQKPRGGIV
jgi:predicted molibdopterin-dependent oxidoreductase YjgC